MNKNSITSQTLSPMPPDDLQRNLVAARPSEDQNLPHIGLVGDTYTILLSGNDTDGRYCLIDMLIPPGGGPPPHRHDFEESFTLLEGKIEAVFRSQKIILRAGETISIPANAPHSFTNASGEPARLLCMCTPPGQEEFFIAVGSPLGSRTEAPAILEGDALAAFISRSKTLAPQYHTELLLP